MPHSRFYNMRHAGRRAEAAPMEPASGSVLIIDIYEPIGDFWGLPAAEFRADLRAAGPVDEIELHLNSPGGEMSAGWSIYQSLVDHKAKKTAHVDGLAASMASVIAMACDRIVMGEGAMMMIHNPWVILLGEASDLRREAEVLDKQKGQLIAAYQRHSPLSADQLASWMNDETWFTGPEAIAAGLAHEVKTSARLTVDEAAEEAASIADLLSPDRTDSAYRLLSQFQNVPQPLSAALRNVNPGAFAPHRKEARMQPLTSTPAGATAAATLPAPTAAPVAPAEGGQTGEQLALDTPPAAASTEAAPPPAEQLATLQAAHAAQVAELERQQTELRARQRDINAEQARLAVDRLVLELGDRLPPAVERAGLRDVLAGLHGRTDLQLTVGGASVPAYDALATVLRALPPALAGLTGETAASAQTVDATVGDNRPEEVRQFHRRAGLSDERIAQLSAKYGIN